MLGGGKSLIQSQGKENNNKSSWSLEAGRTGFEAGIQTQACVLTDELFSWLGPGLC